MFDYLYLIVFFLVFGKLNCLFFVWLIVFNNDFIVVGFKEIFKVDFIIS